MKITQSILSILLFITLCGPAIGANDMTKGEIWFTSMKVQAIYTLNKTTQIEEGSRITFEDGLEIASPEYNTLLHAVLSIDANLWLGSYTFLNIDEFSTFEGGFVLALRMRGVLDVKIKDLPEAGTVIIQTEQAELEVKSKDFSVVTEGSYTYVECYEGEILIPDSTSSHTERLGAGKVAAIFGSDGDKNSIVHINSIQDWRRSKRETRLGQSPEVRWISSSSLPKSR